MVFGQVSGEALGEVVDEVQQAAITGVIESFSGFGTANLVGRMARHGVRQIAVDAARSDIGCVHARTADRLVDIQQILTFAKRKQHDRHGAAVDGVRPDPQQVVEQARDLGKHDADVLGAQGHFKRQHFLDGQAIGLLVAHHRHVIQTVHVRQGLDVGLALGELLGGTVQQADVRVGALDDFAIELEHQTQYAVCSRVLRSKIQGVVLDISHL